MSLVTCKICSEPVFRADFRKHVMEQHPGTLPPARPAIVVLDHWGTRPWFAVADGTEDPGSGDMLWLDSGKYSIQRSADVLIGESPSVSSDGLVRCFARKGDLLKAMERTGYVQVGPTHRRKRGEPRRFG